MLTQSVKKILQNKDFQRLICVRRRLSWSLLLILLGLYLAYGVLTVYYPAFLARPVFIGGIVPVGIAFGYGILLLAFVFTLVYVAIANSLFENLTRKIRAEEDL